MAREDQEEQSLELERLGGIYVIDDWEKTPKLVSYAFLILAHSTLQWRLKQLLHGRSRQALICAIVEDFGSGKSPRAYSSMNVRVASCKLSRMQAAKACDEFS